VTAREALEWARSTMACAGWGRDRCYMLGRNNGTGMDMEIAWDATGVGLDSDDRCAVADACLASALLDGFSVEEITEVES
jgi:hypothetical protein